MPGLLATLRQVHRRGGGDLSHTARQVGRTLLNRTRRVLRRFRSTDTITATMPPSIRHAADVALTRRFTADEQSLISRVEEFRARLAGTTDEQLPSYSSPLPGSFRQAGDAHADPGPLVASDIASHARTGASGHTGVLLRRIAVGYDARDILELGGNIGFSAYYLASAPICRRLVTIEGSAALSEIARSHLRTLPTGTDVTVMNALFDDAIDQLAAKGERFDLVYLDGQHESEATLYYAGRVRQLLRPTGIIVFDDIYWSPDMLDGWQSIVRSESFPFTADLGQVGVATVHGGPRSHVDIGRYTGRPAIAHPARG
ncbi:MAG TPA: class I SAM-dependent methyltransferase [Kribbella sp.]